MKNDSMNETRSGKAAVQSGGFLKLWPFQEAAKLAERVKDDPADRPVLFETGYGPSGLPHIGTFGEVARTSWVRQAFEKLTGRRTRLLAFSDDMDALRKVPDNVPQKEMLERHLGLPLSRIPDPFGKDESFAAHNNARLRAFLDQFGFKYEFASSSEYYRSGRFDAALRRVLECHDEIIKAVAPTLGAERRATYSPVLPIHPETGQVMQVPVEVLDAEKGLIRWKDDAGQTLETCIFGGNAKMQWKADWAMRWYALGVDYEMSGKDLIDSVTLSSKICRILGGRPPQNLTYELFLDAQGQKISKSKGNGLSVEEWLRYGPQESLAHYMFQHPQRARRLYFEAIPKAADDYLSLAQKQEEQGSGEPDLLWFIHGGNLQRAGKSPISFSALLNLAAIANAPDAATLWKFVSRYDESLSKETHPYLDRLMEHAVRYAEERVRPHKKWRVPTDAERAALEDLLVELGKLEASPKPDDVQTLVFEVGKRHFEKAELRSWFGCLYEVLLGQSEGPRFGIFAALYGIRETEKLIRDALAGKLATA